MQLRAHCMHVPTQKNHKRTILPFGRGTPKRLVEDTFFFNSWEHSSRESISQGLLFFIRMVRGADE